jgi:transposase
MYNRLAFMEHYHMRSNIESAFSMIKGKSGDAVRSKSDAGQVNEALCKVLAHNICVLIQAMHALNVEPMFRQPPQSVGPSQSIL